MLKNWEQSKKGQMVLFSIITCSVLMQDVANSTVVTARLREKLQEKPFPQTVFRLPEQKYGETMNRIYGPIAKGCMALQKKVGNYTTERLPVYLEKETEIRKSFVRNAVCGGNSQTFVPCGAGYGGIL